jgi:Zn-dependent protease with chaperone function
MALGPNHKTFPNISHSAFQHPLDKQALATLEKTPFLPQLVQQLSKSVLERFTHIDLVSSNARVHAQQYPSLYKKYIKLAETLDVNPIPELFIDSAHTINAYATGMNSFFIVTYSGLIDMLSENELLAILGHELGHVKCNHMLYMTMVNLIRQYGAGYLIASLLPPVAGTVVSYSIQLALLEWYRKAEFSCDRAALLATQDEEAVVGALSKLAGYSKHLPDAEFNFEAIKDQAQAYDDVGSDSLVDKAVKLWLLMGRTHPHPVVRAREIANWAASPEYHDILDGKFATRQIGAPAGMPMLSGDAYDVQLASDGSYTEGNYQVTPRELLVLEPSGNRKYALEDIVDARVDPQSGRSCALRLIQSSGKETTAAYSKEIEVTQRVALAIGKVCELRAAGA